MPETVSVQGTPVMASPSSNHKTALRRLQAVTEPVQQPINGPGAGCCPDAKGDQERHPQDCPPGDSLRELEGDDLSLSASSGRFRAPERLDWSSMALRRGRELLTAPVFEKFGGESQ
jgi:hypothetical protein